MLSERNVALPEDGPRETAMPNVSHDADDLPPLVILGGPRLAPVDLLTDGIHPREEAVCRRLTDDHDETPAAPIGVGEVSSPAGAGSASS